MMKGCVGEVEWIADHQPRPVGNRRRHEVQGVAKAGRHVRSSQHSPHARLRGRRQKAIACPTLKSGVLPQQEYRARLERWQQAHQRWHGRDRQLGNARLATGLAGLGIAFVSLGPAWISAWWLLAPLVLFIPLAIAHDRVARSLVASGRGVSYNERALARVENRWMGSGDQGERFRNPQHLYADDFDLFGRGSLFELLSTARTAAGHRTLAGWLLAPGARSTVIARQGAVAELRSRIDLREEIALMGEDIRAAVDDRALKEWGDLPPIKFFPYARVVAPVLAVAAVITIVLFLADAATLRPFLYVLLAQLLFAYFVRDPVRRLRASAQALPRASWSCWDCCSSVWNRSGSLAQRWSRYRLLSKRAGVRPPGRFTL